jgi:hypothetical protein
MFQLIICVNLGVRWEFLLQSRIACFVITKSTHKLFLGSSPSSKCLFLLSIQLSVCLFVRSSKSLSVFLSISRLSVCLPCLLQSFCPFVHQYVNTFVFLSVLHFLSLLHRDRINVFCWSVSYFTNSLTFSSADFWLKPTPVQEPPQANCHAPEWQKTVNPNFPA